MFRKSITLTSGAFTITIKFKIKLNCDRNPIVSIKQYLRSEKMERQVEAMLKGGQFKQLLENYVKALREKYGLKRTEIEVLYYLSHCGEQNTAKDIKISLHVNKGLISQTAGTLSQKGYILALKDGEDCRFVHYRITKDAERVTEEIDAAIDRLYKALFDGISEDDREALQRIATKMAYNFSRIMQEEN